MKKQFIIPMVVAASMAMFTACSDDSGSSPAMPSNPEIDQPVVPGENGGVVTPEQPGDVIDPNAPVVNPNESVVNPDTPAVPGGDVAPETPVENPDAPVANPGQPAVTDPNVSYSYYGAELTGLEQFKYGRFEARMKMVSIPGSVSSMFLYYDDSHRLKEYVWNEIDIEVLGKTDTVWQANLITREMNETDKTDACVKDKNGDCRKITSESKPKFGFHASEDFHLYAMIWTPEYISWEIDSVEVRRDTLGFEKKPGHDQVAFMTEEQSLRFNLWVSNSTSWVGKFTGNELADGPKIQYIDYVRTYKYDTATKTFTLNWQDDFDGDDLNPERWSKGSWQMEKVWYRDENLVVKDGMCQMILSREAD